LAGILLPSAPSMLSAGSRFAPALVTPQSAASTPILLVAALSAIMSSLPIAATLRALGQTRYVFNAFFWRLLATAAFVLAGLHFFGMLGAISGHLIAEGVVRTAMLDRIRRELGSKWRDMLPWAELRHVAIASLAGCVPVVVIARYAYSGARPLLA